MSGKWTTIKSKNYYVRVRVGEYIQKIKAIRSNDPED